jgi:hypothetical protein
VIKNAAKPRTEVVPPLPKEKPVVVKAEPEISGIQTA